MKRTLYLLVLASVVLTYGCSPSRKASRSSPTLPDVSSGAHHGTITLYPKGYEPTAEEVAAAGSDFAADYANMTFSGIETEHVRVRGVNPLPETGILEVDLDGLRSQFVYPYKGKFISDYGIRNGRPHTGVDIKAVADDTIRSVLPGVVRMAREYSSYGNVVVIRHYCGFETVYAHCSRNLVRPNDRVRAGTPVGLAGRTGRATTEHLHFEVRIAGEPVDPKLLLDMERHTLKNGKLYARNHGGSIIAYNDPDDFSVSDGRLPTAGIPAPQIPKSTVVDDAPEVIRLEKGETYRAGSTESLSSSGTSQASYHTVVKGDTLYAIARRYSTSVKELCRLNGIAETDILSLGQKVRYK